MPRLVNFRAFLGNLVKLLIHEKLRCREIKFTETQRKHVIEESVIGNGARRLSFLLFISSFKPTLFLHINHVLSFDLKALNSDVPTDDCKIYELRLA